MDKYFTLTLPIAIPIPDPQLGAPARRLTDLAAGSAGAGPATGRGEAWPVHCPPPE
jgi:hypothetical protein